MECKKEWITYLEKPKEVALEKEAVMFCFDKGINISPGQAKELAHYFYELGKNSI